MKRLLLIPALSFGCARTWVNYPPETRVDADGRTYVVAARAVELNGTDSLGDTVITVSRNEVRIASAGGLDNSTSTKIGHETIRHGLSAGATIATAGFAYGAYVAEQNAAAASNVAASRASAASAAAASRTAAPAAGSTINAITPAIVTPIP